MTPGERETARAALIEGVSIIRLIDDFGHRSYRDLISSHVSKLGTNLPGAVSLHRDLVTPYEEAAALSILDAILQDARGEDFWATAASDVLSAVSCDLNDELFPHQAEEAGIFNLFQLVTLTLADRVRTDSAFAEMVEHAPHAQPRSTGESGTITRHLGIAISDHEAGRLSRRHLVQIFQDAIDNGDLLLPENEFYVTTYVVPLIDAGELHPGPAVGEFEQRMNKKAAEYAKGLRSHGRPSRAWWQFWR